MQALRDSITKHEGLRLKPYRDTEGKLTIGYGRNLDDVGITKDEAQAMLDGDIAKAISELDRAFDGWRDHSPARQAVLAEMCFNLGAPRLSGFTKMWSALKAKNYTEAAKQMLHSRWAVQVGQRAVTLADRMRAG